jgi:hypothetical protein
MICLLVLRGCFIAFIENDHARGRIMPTQRFGMLLARTLRGCDWGY